jgi:hypothetical protein
MTYPNGQGLYDLEPTDAELDDLLEVLDEVEAEEALGGLPGEADLANDYGPWDGYVDLSGGLERASAALDASMTTEAQRQAADLTDALERRPTFERRWARAIGRIGDGTYTPPAYYRPAEPETACNAHRDAYGRCGARFHSPLCLETARQEASTGSARAVEAWNVQLLSNQATSPVDLAAPTGLDRDWADLLGADSGPGVPADLETLNAMREMLGISSRELPSPARFPTGEL